MKTTGWPSNVNDIILDETTITIGEGGTVEDSSQNGFKNKRATSLVTGNTFPVVMLFNWDGSDKLYPQDNKGLTEFDRWERWYKYTCKRGSIPFWFPTIDKQSIDVLHAYDENGNPITSSMSLYKITSTPSAQKSGLDMRVTMTWEEVYSGVIEIESNDEEYDENPLTAEDDRSYIRYKTVPEVTPSLDKLSLSYVKKGSDDEPVSISIKRASIKGNTLVMYYEKLDVPAGTYIFTWSYEDKTFTDEVRFN